MEFKKQTLKRVWCDLVFLGGSARIHGLGVVLDIYIKAVLGGSARSYGLGVVLDIYIKARLVVVVRD